MEYIKQRLQQPAQAYSFWPEISILGLRCSPALYLQGREKKRRSGQMNQHLPGSSGVFPEKCQKGLIMIHKPRGHGICP
jgi:hypothetical protein